MVPHPTFVKLLVFAHTPPPHHGQSYMVKLMLDRLGGDARKGVKSQSSTDEIECYHVNARYSENLEDIGSFRFAKAWLVVRYCLEAIWCRFRYGVTSFYYVPAPGKRAALYRDWIVMILCRPFFRHFVHHWHAVGLGDWLRREGTWIECWLTHRLLGNASLGIALAIPSMRDALWFCADRVEVVANGIPDPCPHFESEILPRRKELFSKLQALLANPQAQLEPLTLRVLFLAHCTRSKGLFDTLDAAVLARELLREGKFPIQVQLTIAGAFMNAEEERAFVEYIQSERLSDIVHYVGFITGTEKDHLLRQSDFFCFPTFYEAEGQPVNLIEAMAYGIPPVTTRWRGIPDLLPSDYPGLVMIHSPHLVASKLIELLRTDFAETLRKHFLSKYTEQRHVDALQEAFRNAAG
jgi:glycosyltransferase involved in cell wall biosynthesis